MDTLPIHFCICETFGLWIENHDFYKLKFIWRIVVFSILVFFNSSQIVGLIMLNDNVIEITEVLFSTTTFFALLLKMLNFVSRRGEMCDLLDCFRLPPCLPKTREEEAIVKKYRKKIIKVYVVLMILSLSCGISLLVGALLSLNEAEVRLPFKVYNLYDISISINYWISYSIQFFSIIVGVIINVTMDSMVYSFLLLVTCQIEIISYRMTNCQVSMKELVVQHVLLRDIVIKIQNYFMRVIVPLFVFSLITLCVSIFQISQVDIISVAFLSIVLYLSCIISQIFFYCWYGSEIKSKSDDLVNTIYSSNWLILTKSQRRSACFVMLSAQSIPHISYRGQCQLSLNTFIWIINTSYAAFNVLKHASISEKYK